MPSNNSGSSRLIQSSSGFCTSTTGRAVTRSGAAIRRELVLVFINLFKGLIVDERKNDVGEADVHSHEALR